MTDTVDDADDDGLIRALAALADRTDTPPRLRAWLRALASGAPDDDTDPTDDTDP